ncbi:MAG: transglycosylase SLT domain-containing protein, partial [Firmicutes bacterium]|nr:transglycosylase SLT domain-containing protein [Bacillota bacterium]
LDDATDIIISDSGVYYGSLNFFKNSLGIDACYREGRGLYLSTDPAVSAEEWAERDTNPSYIEGMTKYIMSVNKALSEKEAADIEFLIRHVAGQYKYMTPELVSGIIMVESRFRPYIENSVGATGLMQVLIKYAKVRGYTVSMLKDPHINLEYGVEFMNRLITGYRGDVTAGLAAYNMGAAYVRSGGDYNKAYPNAVYGKMSDMKNWLTRNGYSAEFREQL